MSASDNEKTEFHDFPAEEQAKNSGTVLSATEVEKLVTRPPKDADATAMAAFPEMAANVSQVVSDATEKLSGKNEATVLAGGTEAMAEKPEPFFTPKIGVGSVINDRFTLKKLLGRGGMGEVYLATDKRKVEAQDKDSDVAFKILGDAFKRHPQAMMALQRESKKSQQLSHPNIITVYDFDRQGDNYYITMEALQGKPMDEDIRSEGNLRPQEEAISLITQTALGLAYAHEKGFVHSDLKPGNIWVTPEGRVKLLDFGIARAFKGKIDEKTGKNSKDDTVFDAGELGALTPAYASLEMINGEEPHPSDDVYALGLIAYELLTGKHPFKKKMATKALEEGVPLEKIKTINSRQWKAISGALAFKREDRIQDAQAFLDQFTAKSKAPLIVSSVVISLIFTVMLVWNLNKEKEIVQGPEIPFAELPQDKQQQVLSALKEADMAIQFNDYNGALIYLNNAFLLHKYNPEVMTRLDTVLDQMLPQIKSVNLDEQKKMIDNLMKYDSLETNKKLLEYQASLRE